VRVLIPGWLASMRGPGLGPKVVFGTTSGDTGFLSCAALARDLGTSERSVRRWAEELADRGLWELNQAGRQGFEFVLLVDRKSGQPVRTSETGRPDNLSGRGLPDTRTDCPDESTGQSVRTTATEIRTACPDERPAETPRPDSLSGYPPGGGGGGAAPTSSLDQDPSDPPPPIVPPLPAEAAAERSRGGGGEVDFDAAAAERDRLALASKSAMKRVIEARGGEYQRDDREQHLEVGTTAAAYAEKHGLELREVLDVWAKRWIETVKVRSARSWATFVAAEVSGAPWRKQRGREDGYQRAPAPAHWQTGDRDFGDGDIPASEEDQRVIKYG